MRRLSSIFNDTEDDWLAWFESVDCDVDESSYTEDEVGFYITAPCSFIKKSRYLTFFF